MNTMNENTMTNVRWTMKQNRATMRKLELETNEASENNLPGARDPLPPPVDNDEETLNLHQTATTPYHTVNEMLLVWYCLE